MLSFRNLLLLGVCVTGLGACSPDKPWLMEETNLAPQKIQLVESRHIVKKPLNALSSSDIADTAALYGRKGAGPMYVVIAYNEHGKVADHKVSERAASINADLQSNGVAARDIIAGTVPLETPDPVVLIAFDTLEAAAPKDCTDMPSLQRLPGTTEDFNYKLGCGVNGMIAQQISDPTDLEGKAGLGGHADGERAANIAVNYRKGETLEYLPSYIISDLAGSGQ